MHRKVRFFSGLSVVIVLALFVAGSLQVPGAAAQDGVVGPAGTQVPRIWLPNIARSCSTGQTYGQGIVTQWDTDNPVRPAYNHAGKNWSMRGYTERTGPGFTPGLVNYGAGTDPNTPQFKTFFSPARMQFSGHYYQTYGWNYAPSPSPGTKGSLLTENNGSYAITAIGLTTTPGELIRLPIAGYDLGQGVRALVIYADADSIALKYTREDSVATGYTIFVEGICTDSSLLALYNSLDNSTRNTFVGRGAQFYNLPTLTYNQPFALARSTEIVVAITDTGAFLDPRSCNDWWKDYGGFGFGCTVGPP
jgi:hypothetical protein